MKRFMYVLLFVLLTGVTYANRQSMYFISSVMEWE